MLRDNKDTKFGSSDQEASSSTGKNTGVVLVPYCALKCIPAAIFCAVDISMFTGFQSLRQMIVLSEVTKITSRIGVL